ncbi:DUF2853 family protein [Falsihalocynthiibacter sp. BN13B15]|uniref:DUF2853 family protein n=1 Tax=Falsihalocynthiibacter sp. BN13B15 TaxID=3240871 RepID=UPI00350EC962
MEYDLMTLRPSQERRLLSTLDSDIGRDLFLSKLQKYLSPNFTGGEGEKDQITSLATRLSALDVWSKITLDQLTLVANTSNFLRLEPFVEGLPEKFATVFESDDWTPRTRVYTGGGTRVYAGGKRDQLIEKYAKDLRRKVGFEPDIDLLKRVTIACGPSIYNRRLATITTNISTDLEKVKNQFLIKSLGLPDNPNLMTTIHSVIDQHGRSDKHIDRAVLYYLLVRQFSKDKQTLQWLDKHSNKSKTARSWLVRS